MVAFVHKKCLYAVVLLLTELQSQAAAIFGGFGHFLT